LIRRLSEAEARFVLPVGAPQHEAASLHEKLADARRLRVLRAELESELRERLPPLLRALFADRPDEAELEPRLEALYTALFGSRAP
jgi:hypothetical protein